MRGLSLTQPWASLITAGEKRIETRAWSTAYRGPVAIHAAQKFPPEIADLCFSEPFARVLHAHGFITSSPLSAQRLEDGGTGLVLRQTVRLPRGVIVAVVKLEAVQRTEHIRDVLDSTERAFGDYRDGRYAWLLEDVRALPEPVPCRGGLGLWPVPAEIAARLERWHATGPVTHP